MIERTVIEHKFKLGDKIFVVCNKNEVSGPVEITAVIFTLDKYSTGIVYEAGPFYRNEEFVYTTAEEAQKGVCH